MITTIARRDDEEPDEAPARAATAASAGRAERVGGRDRGPGPVLVAELRLDHLQADAVELAVGERRVLRRRQVVGAPVDGDGEQVVLAAEVVRVGRVVGPLHGIDRVRELVDVGDEELAPVGVRGRIHGRLDVGDLRCRKHAGGVDDGRRAECHRVLRPCGRDRRDDERDPQQSCDDDGTPTYRPHAPAPFLTDAASLWGARSARKRHRGDVQPTLRLASGETT